MSEEPEITINGVALTDGQAMVVRVAVSGVHSEVSAAFLGDDALGKMMAKLYLDRLNEVLDLMFRPKAGA